MKTVSSAFGTCAAGEGTFAYSARAWWSAHAVAGFLSRNGSLALVQRSDVLQVGDKMKLDITPAFYSMVFRAPARNCVVYNDWIRGTVFVWSPILRELQTARISVDRQTAALEGDLRNASDHSIGRLKLRCQAKDNDSVPEPKF